MCAQAVQEKQRRIDLALEEMNETVKEVEEKVKECERRIAFEEKVQEAKEKMKDCKRRMALAKEKAACVKEPRHYIFDPKKPSETYSCWGLESDVVVHNALVDPSTVFLQDPAGTNPAFPPLQVTAFTIPFVSPRKEHRGQFNKRVKTILYYPIRSLEELLYHN